MAAVIPPLDFSRSPTSFRAAEATTPSIMESDNDDDDSGNAVETPTPAPRQSFHSFTVEPLRIRRRDTITSHRSSSTPNKLVKRNPSQAFRRTSSRLSKDKWKSYRCDIHSPSSSSHTATENSCKTLVLEEGGKILDDFVFPGGFLYQLPTGWFNPLASGAVTESDCEAHIEVTAWQPFAKPVFDGLRMAPCGTANELLLQPLLVKKKTTTTTTTMMTLPMVGMATMPIVPIEPRASVCGSVCESVGARKRLSVWLSSLIRADRQSVN